MPHVIFTPQLQRFLDAPPREVAATTVAGALARVFADNPRLKRYILDDHGQVRTHVAVFVGGARVKDRRRLTDAVTADAEIFVLQALSGG
jgi:molybdopterin synthase sulfur carrier subunit